MSEPEAFYKITHVEIRRVQNGFVIMGFDFRPNYHMQDSSLQRVSFVARDIDDLRTVIGNILLSGEIDWLPTADLPLTGLIERTPPK